MPLQNHHSVPWQNSTYNHQQHPLVQLSGINLRTSPHNQFMLGNHAGPHSANYHRIVQRLLNTNGNGVQTQQGAQTAVQNVMQTIQQGVTNGTIRPYNNKQVFVP